MPVAKPTFAVLVLTTILTISTGCSSNSGSAANSLALAGLSSDQESPLVSLAATSDIRPAATPAAISDFNAAMQPFNRRLGEHLGVLTFNMEHKDQPEQLAVMAQHLRSDLREMPDFVLCQEVMFNRSERKVQENTAEVLGDALGYYARGTKRSSDREGVAILSRYPFEFYDSRALKSQTSPLLFGFNRVSIMGEFKVPAVGLVRVVNVHLTNWRFEEHVRTNQLRETLQWITERDQLVHADVTILGGDFNMLPDGNERPLVTDHRETGALQFKDYNTNDPTRGPDGRPSVRVDYLFIASPQCDVKFLGEDRLFKDGLRESDGDRFYLSDHVPVLHQYAIKAAAATNRTATVQATIDAPATLLR